MSSFVLKIIAIISMLCDHSGDAFIGGLSPFNIIGRIAFPIFAFQLVIGYKNTSNFKKYMTRLVIFALISQIPFYIFTHDVIHNDTLILNIFFTLILGIMGIVFWDHFSNKFLKVISVIAIASLAQLIRVDYGYWGVLLILFIYLFCPTINKDNHKSNKANLIVFVTGYLALCFIKFFSYFKLVSVAMTFALMLFTFLPIIFMLLYNGKKGPSIKYFFYLFYPVHLLILDLLVLVFHI